MRVVVDASIAFRLNQFCATPAAEKLAVLETADCIAPHAPRADDAAFEAVPTKVPAGNPEEERDQML